MLEHGIAQQFIRPKARKLFFVAENVPAAMDYLRHWRPSPVASIRPSQTAPTVLGSV
jgi:hypothetical protein